MGSVIEQPRNARSRRTLEALLSSARTLLEEQGFEALTMAAVAEQAGVTRRAVYLHFSSRAELLAALFDYVNEGERLAESVAPVWTAPDAVTALQEWAAHTARFAPRIMAVARAVDGVHRHDPDAAEHRMKAARARHEACRRLMTRLAGEGCLADGWTVDEAADMLMALSSLDVVETLLVDRAWSHHRFVEHFTALLLATFVADPAAEPARIDDGPGRRAPNDC